MAKYSIGMKVIVGSPHTPFKHSGIIVDLGEKYEDFGQSYRVLINVVTETDPATHTFKTTKVETNVLERYISING